jgi:hypothetical protein
MSAPDEKARSPAPVSTTARTSSSVSMISRTAINRSIIA